MTLLTGGPVVLCFIPNDAFRPPPGKGDSPQSHAPRGAGLVVTWLFVASLAMGLGAVLVLYFIMRARAAVWPPPGTPPLPAGLWLSTAIILASSLAVHVALLGARRGRPRRLRAGILWTVVLAMAFVVSQLANWGWALAARMPPDLNMFSVLFYLLTGLHGLHVVGGLVPLAVVTYRAFRGAYGPQEHRGVTYLVIYWHFLDVAWLAMFAALLLGRQT